MEKIKIDDREVRLMPKQYRHKEDELTCDEVMCGKIASCDSCPFISKDVIKIKDLDIIETNEKLIEVEISSDTWYIADKTIAEAEEEGICCYDVYCKLHDEKAEFECEHCIFRSMEILDLESINYRI